MEPDIDDGKLDSFLTAHEPVEFAFSYALGELFGDWRVTAFLGRGGSGEVYRVVHASLGTEAALKVCVRDAERDDARDAAVCDRFRREAKLLAGNAHPAFPRFLGFGERDGRPWYVMELLEHRPLPTGERSVAQFLLAVTSGVRHLHSIGLVHRDIKPANILWRGSSPVLADLGLVKETSAVRGHAGDSLSVVDGKAVGVGTPRYGAPEQMERGEVSFASDIHALGVLADHCFGGRPPRTWARIIRRATSSIPAYRYLSIAAFVRAIRMRHLARNAMSAIAGLCTVVALSWCLARITSPMRTSAVEFSSAYAKWDKISASIVSNGITYTAVNLHSNRHEIAELMTVNGPQVLTIEGPGQLVAAISGPSNVTVRLKGCCLINRTRVPFPQNAISYVLESKATSLDFGFQFYPTNLVRGARRMGPFVPNDTSDMRMTFRR